MTEQERNELVIENKNLVLSIAHKYKGRSAPGIDFDDIYQAGIIGLIQGIDRYDPSEGTQLSTYVVPWIEREIRYALGIELPCYISGKVGKIYNAMADIDATGQAVTAEAVADAVNLPVSRVKDAMPRIKGHVSMDATVNSDSDDSFVDFTESTDESSNIFQTIASQLDAEGIRKAIKRLPLHQPTWGKVGEDKILEAYNNIPRPDVDGFDAALAEYAKLYNEWVEAQSVDKVGAEVLYDYYIEGMKLHQISKKMGVSKQCIQQKCKSALKKLALDPLIIGANNQ